MNFEDEIEVPDSPLLEWYVSIFHKIMITLLLISLLWIAINGKL